MSSRKSIYFREGKDKDLSDYIEKLLVNYDFSEIARGLMRDGIKYREERNSIPLPYSIPNTYAEKDVPPETEATPINLDLTSDLTPKVEPIPDFKLSKKEVSKDELKNRLDEF